ncbi:MAG: response regulator [Chitinophagales bacterium]
MKTEAKVLIAEDNVMNQMLIKHLLRSRGYKFDLVPNGAEAVEALKRQSYDLILMDIQMPEMDGYSATEQIRQALRSSVPIIAMTAHAMSGNKEKCIKAGMNDFITKPLDADALFDMMQRHLKQDLSGGSHVQKTVDGINGDTVIDLCIVEKYSHGNADFKNEIIKEFVTIVPGNISSLENAISEGNYKQIGRIAHDMKTTVHVMGLTTLIGDLLIQIENFAKSNAGLALILNIFSDIKQVCLRAVREANRLVVA